MHLRYGGTDTALPVPLSEPGFMRRDFEALHRQRFGFISPEKDIVAAAIEVAAASGEDGGDGEISSPPARRAAAATATRFYSRGEWHEAPVVLREALVPGTELAGPALVIEPHQTIVVEPGWKLALTARNDIVMTRAVPRARERLTSAADPVLLEVFNNLFMAIAEQMGEALRNTAQSVNIKERLDFSCAVFDATGALVANAPHLPVHLGSMDRSVETIIRERGAELRPGDAYMLNAPYNGGTHLPDITVVTPVFDDAGARVLFYVASRGHHEDIGGLTPGSMTPRATTIERGRRLHRQRQARRWRTLPRRRDAHAVDLGANIPRAAPTRTSPTSRRRSPPTPRAKPS